MKNLILQPQIRRKIDIRIDKILHDLGDPEPPLGLEDVRELLRLDLGYYQTDSDGILLRAAHTLIMAGKQVWANPMRLREAVKKWSIRALWVPESCRRSPKMHHLMVTC